MSKMKGADLIAEYLVQEKVPYVFGICGHGNVGMLDCVAAVILCFLVCALDREHGGRVQERIGALDRVREMRAPPG